MIQLPVFLDKDLIPVLGIGLATTAYFLYWYLPVPVRLKTRPSTFMPEKQVNSVVLRRVYGVLFLGIIPAWIILRFTQVTPEKFGMIFSFNKQSLLWLLLLLILSGIPVYLSRKSSANLNAHPQFMIKKWTHSLVIVNTISWFGFLAAYELLFRGILFLSIMDYWDFWPVLVLNVSIYSLVHFPKGRRETLASLPFGFILCLLTYYTQSVWPAIILHLFVALFNDFITGTSHFQSGNLL